MSLDFNGEVWARVKYANGETKENEHLLLAKRVELGNEISQTNSNQNANAANSNTNAQNQNSDTN